MKPIRLTATDNTPFNVSPLALVAWFPANVQVEGVTLRGSNIVLSGMAVGRPVQESVREIDAAFEEATTARVDEPSRASDVPPAG